MHTSGHVPSHPRTLRSPGLKRGIAIKPFIFLSAKCRSKHRAPRISALFLFRSMPLTVYLAQKQRGSKTWKWKLERGNVGEREGRRAKGAS